MLCATREYYTSACEAGVWNVLFRDEQPPRLVPPRFHELRLWRARAISSFPVPVSPQIKTVESAGATVSISLKTRRSTSLLPMISSK
jgi:hypothetical protein